MELLSWLKLRLSTRVDFPGGDGGQCVDLANDYITAVWHIDPIRANARDWPAARITDTPYILNAPRNHPDAGDVVCWRGPLLSVGINMYGHVAVCLAASSNYLLTVDQNWASVKAARIVLHDYRGVDGWFAAGGIP